ncbi:MAG TPA: hypothetical protein VFW73_06550 [Lacipirellulaceae bacterium]|nr:hypothetical protein [Lacipirellulaceae bacterium]
MLNDAPFPPLGRQSRFPCRYMSQPFASRAFFVPKLHRVFEFFGSQGLATAGNLFYGFLCVRLLPFSGYAKYAVAFGFLGSLTVLMDVGISGTLLPLIGERIDDRELIADYVATVRQLAHWVFLLVALIAIVVFPLIVRKQHWGWETDAAIISAILVAGWCARVGGTYGAVLIVRRDRTVWYRVQIVASYGTLALLGICWAGNCLNAMSAILINVAGMAFASTAYFVRARHLLGLTGRASREKRNAILHLALPSMPNSVFYAWHGQIALVVITFFGHAVAVASLGALSRLAQMFLLLSQMNPLLIEPYFAKLPRALLKRNYVLALVTAGSVCVCVGGLAACFPELYLWVLGQKYSSLHLELLLIIVASCIYYLQGVMWTIHTSRRFVYWWNNTAVICVTLAIEIFFIVRVDLSTVRGVLTMNLATAAGALVLSILTGVYGFARGPREIRETTVTP